MEGAAVSFPITVLLLLAGGGNEESWFVPPAQRLWILGVWEGNSGQGTGQGPGSGRELREQMAHFVCEAKFPA